MIFRAEDAGLHNPRPFNVDELSVSRDPTQKHSSRTIVTAGIYLFGGLLLGVICYRKFPFLDVNQYMFFYCGPIVLSLGSYLVPRFSKFLRHYRFNWFGRFLYSIPTTALLFCLGVAANCVDNHSSQTRELPCLAKMSVATTRGGTRYYLKARPWGSVRHDTDIQVSPEFFASVTEGENLRITTGLGRLGIEWIRSVEAGSVTYRP